MIGTLTGMVISGLAGGMSGIHVDTLAEVCVTVVAVVVITLGGIAPASLTIDSRDGAVFDTDVFIVVRADVMVKGTIDAFSRRVNGAVPDIGISADVNTNMWATVMADLKFTISL